MDKLKTIFAMVLGVDQNSINDATSPENTPSWDSLNAVVLVTEIEKGFNVVFNYNEVMAIRNFTDAVALVRAKGGAI